MPSVPHDSLSRISHALSRAQSALETSSSSVLDLESKIADSKSEIISISQQINSLRALMAKKYDEQEAFEDLLPVAVEERERAATRVKRLEDVLKGVERHLAAEAWYEEEELEEFNEGAKAERFKRYLTEVGRAHEVFPVEEESDFDESINDNLPQPIILNQSFQAEDMNAVLHTDVRIPSPSPRHPMPLAPTAHAPQPQRHSPSPPIQQLSAMSSFTAPPMRGPVGQPPVGWLLEQPSSPPSHHHLIQGMIPAPMTMTTPGFRQPPIQEQVSRPASGVSAYGEPLSSVKRQGSPFEARYSNYGEPNMYHGIPVRQSRPSSPHARQCSRTPSPSQEYARTPSPPKPVDDY